MATDNFTRADALTLGANWTEQVSGFGIKSNQAYALNSATYQFAFWNAASFNADQYAELTFAAIDNQQGPTVRAAGTGATTSCYWLLCRPSAQGSSWIYKNVNGTLTGLTDLGAVAWAATDVARLEVSGTTITAKRNGSTLNTATDSALASGSPGLFSLDSGTFSGTYSNAASLWTGANLSGGAVLRSTGSLTTLGVQ